MAPEDEAPELFAESEYADELFTDDRKSLRAVIEEAARPADPPPAAVPKAASESVSPTAEDLALPLDFTSLTELGEYFKTLRNRRRLSIEQIAAETRIRAAYIEAIEAGDPGSLPPVFLIAYIRRLAQLYRVNCAPLEALFEQLRSDGEVEIPEDVNKFIVGRAEDETQARRRNQLALALLGASAVVVLAVVIGVVMLVLSLARNGWFDSGAKLTEDDLIRLQKPTPTIRAFRPDSPAATGQKR